MNSECRNTGGNVHVTMNVQTRFAATQNWLTLRVTVHPRSKNELDEKDPFVNRNNARWISTLVVCFYFPLLSAFAKLRKTTITFVMSVCPSVRKEQLGSHWTDLHKI
jgi:hypothetical protein